MFDVLTIDGHIVPCEECYRPMPDHDPRQRLAAWFWQGDGVYRCEDCERETERLTVAPYELAGRVIA